MIFTILQLLVSISLIVVILMQMQGTGLSNSFGGGGEFYRSRRSIERLLVSATVVLTSLFAILSIVLLFPH
ncbi:MAG: preprotein translocase subunit SecG [Candidatus Levybacteria bacterium]|nr:preprotein translocase subunit SecG [Candidatus Levybacteria bacterium]